MRNLVLIAVAGAIGSVARYGVGEWAVRSLGDGFPWGTLAVNALGSVILGLVVGLHAGGKLPLSGKLAFGTGFCGGFTTFSTFSAETVALVQRDQLGRAGANVAVSLALGIAGAWIGIAVARAMAPS